MYFIKQIWQHRLRIIIGSLLMTKIRFVYEVVNYEPCLLYDIR